MLRLRDNSVKIDIRKPFEAVSLSISIVTVAALDKPPQIHILKSITTFKQEL